MKKELSKKNEFWIPKERYLELQHFCRQYDIWVRALTCIDSKAKKGEHERVDGTFESNPTVTAAEAREYYISKLDMIHDSAYSIAEPYVANCIIECVTRGSSYDQLNAKYMMPVGRNTFYKLCRKFYWKLSMIRR